MRKYFYYNLILVSVLVFLQGASLVHASAPQMQLITTKDSVSQYEQFYVDVSLDADDVSINGFDGVVSFDPEKLSFVHADYTDSISDFWVTKPSHENKSGSIALTGIISAGFSGLIDPFDPENKKTGKIIRLIFEPKKIGPTALYSKGFTITKHDGKGTLITTIPVRNVVEITDTTKVTNYLNEEDSDPEMEYYITRDRYLLNNKYVLIFNKKDTGSGIKEVFIKEGFRNWTIAESPYVLKDQTRRSKIILQYTNFSGKSTFINIEPEKNTIIDTQKILSCIILVLVLLAILKYHVNTKKNGA